jgi:Protein of unknown function (DUF3027)
VTNNSSSALLELAKAAAADFAKPNALGDFVESVEEEPGVTTFMWQSTHAGYLGWRVAAIVAHFGGDEPTTVSEVLLVPGADALVAPDWVPWSERLADYQALQAELEKQAALDAELAAAEGDDSEDADDEDADAEDADVEDSLEESDDQEAEADSIVANELSEEAEETGRG